MDKKPKSPKNTNTAPAKSLAFSFKQHTINTTKKEEGTAPDSKAFHQTINSILRLHQQETNPKKKFKPKP